MINTREKLLSAMSEHKLNAKKVAGMLKVSPSCVYNWRNGWSPMPERQWELFSEQIDRMAPKSSGPVMVLDDDWVVR